MTNRRMRILRLFTLLGTLFVLAHILTVLARLSTLTHAPSVVGSVSVRMDDNLNHLTTTGAVTNSAAAAATVVVVAAAVPTEIKTTVSTDAADDATTRRPPIIDVELLPSAASRNRTTATATRTSSILGDSSSWQPPPPPSSLGSSSLCSSSIIMNNNDTTAVMISQHFQHAPQWVQCYVLWHREMRRIFPGTRLLDDPKAPGILIRYCDRRRAHHGLCGGLHDRLGNLASWVYLANQTQRILLYKWFNPLPLETFLQPNLVDWTVPDDDGNDDRFDSQHIHKHRGVMYQWKTVRKAYKGDIAARLKTEDLFRNERILVANADATIQKFPQQLRALGETDMMDGNGNGGNGNGNSSASSFGEVFRAFFRPSSRLQIKIDDTLQSLDLQPGHYVAAHARVRHPARYSAYTWRLVGKDNTTDADESGLPWTNPSPERDAAIQSAIHAIQCSRLLLVPLHDDDDEKTNNNVTVYFYSDSEDLVRFMTNQTVLSNNNNTSRRSIHEETLHNNNASSSLSLETWHEKAAAALSLGEGGGKGKGLRVVSRRMGDRPTAHLDRGERQDANLDDYLDTFLDLYIAIYARCISYGFGNYAFFAAKISGTNCLQRHERPAASVAKMWNQQSRGELCPIPASSII